MVDVLGRLAEGPLFVVSVAVFLAIMELAYRLGRRRHPRTEEVVRSHILALQGALIGLLSLLLGFNFAMAVARFDVRKNLIQEEASAVTTAHLRAQLLPARDRQEATELLKAYVAIRIEFMRALEDNTRIQAAAAAAARVQTQVWTLVERVVTQNPPFVVPFVQSMNDVITVGDKRRAALDNHVPETVLHLLAGVALVTLGFIAYGYGLSGGPRHAASVIFALLIAAVLTVIVDLDRPRSGFIRVGEDSMVRVQETLTRTGR
jgi:hypothetical protein